MSKEILFEIKKSDSNLLRYYVIDIPQPNFQNVQELEEYLKRHNEEEGKTTTLYRVTNTHVVEAILHKESVEMIKGRVESVVDEMKSLESSFEDQLRDIRLSVESLYDFVKDKMDEYDDE